MAWIESHTGLERHPKLIRFKSKMRWSKNEAIGFLHRFWWTVLEYAPDGVISALPPEVMPEVLDMPSEQTTAVFAAMMDCGFLEQRQEIVVVHDWWQHVHRYLIETRFKGEPERVDSIRAIYGAFKRLSKESPRKVLGKSKVPTNQPTNQPTGAASGGEDLPEPDEELERQMREYIGGHKMIVFSKTTRDKLLQLIKAVGWERAKTLIEQGVTAGAPFPIGWAIGKASNQYRQQVAKQPSTQRPPPLQATVELKG